MAPPVPDKPAKGGQAGNYKYQAPNSKQIPNLNIQITDMRSVVWNFEFGYWDLFVFWNL